MSSNNEQSIQLNSDLQKKSSFDERVCDDLCEVLLKYLPIKDAFRLESVSKQFQSNIFLPQKVLYIGQNISSSEPDQHYLFFLTPWYLRGNSAYIDCQLLANILKKCPNISDIIFGNLSGHLSPYNSNEVFQTIVNWRKSV